MLAAVADVPRIHFGVGTGELLHDMGQAGADVVGVDWRVPLDDRGRPDRPGQGRPGQPRPDAGLRAHGGGPCQDAARSLEAGRAAEGHVFNLGHGVLPETDPDVLTRVVAHVHEASAR